MIDLTQRAARSHSFGINSMICSLCRRPLWYFHEHGWAFCSASWTGRPATVCAVGVFVAGPIVWVRSGQAWSIRIGRLLIFRLTWGWKLGWL